MDTVKDTPKAEEKPAKEAVKTPAKELAQKYLVIKNFTADKQYYVGNAFVTDNKTLADQLLKSKLIK
jgi:hypothetical protein